MGFPGRWVLMLLLLGTASAWARTDPPGWMRTASLTGEVVGTDGPLVGAKVKLELLVGHRRLLPKDARTRANGTFQFENIPPGAYSLICSAKGHASLRQGIWVLPGKGSAGTVRLGRSVALAGSVIDDDGRSVSGAQVQVFERGSEPAGSAVSGQTGRFVVDGLHPGSFRVAVKATGYAGSIRRGVVVPGRGVRLRMVRLHRVWGHVLGGQAARVRIAGSGIWPGRSTTTDGGGRFVFAEVPAGVYELVAATIDGASKTLASELQLGLSVGPHPPPPVVLGLKPAQRIEGVVLAGGKPVAKATVALGLGTGSVLRQRARTDDAGRFQLEPLVHGSYRLSVWARGFLPVVARAVEVPQPQLPLEVTVSRGGRVSGRVVDLGGNPVEGAQLHAVYRRGKGRSSAVHAIGELGVIPGPVPPIPPPGLHFSAEALPPPVSSASGRSERDGGFHLSGLPSGELRVVARHPSHAETHSDWVQLRGEGEIQVHELVLRPASRLSGYVLDRRGLGIYGARVTVEISGARSVVFTERDGAYAFDGLSGRVKVEATSRGYLPAGRAVSLREGRAGTLDLTLSKARGVVAGFVLDPARLPVAGVAVVARRGTHRVSGRTDRRGFFELTGVGTRPVELHLSHKHYVPLRLRVPPGRDQEITLAYTASITGHVEDRRTGGAVGRYQLVLRGNASKSVRRLRIDDPGGAFTVRGLGPGRWEITVEAKGYAVGRRRIDVNAPSRRDEVMASGLRVTLDRAGRVVGRVTRRRDRLPVTGASVSVAGVEGKTGPDGRFRLGGVREGSHRVTVTVKGRSERSDPVVVRADQTSGPVRIEVD